MSSRFPTPYSRFAGTACGKREARNGGEDFQHYKKGAAMKNGIDGAKRDKKREKVIFKHFQNLVTTFICHR
jgi:hypothetical protein